MTSQEQQPMTTERQCKAKPTDRSGLYFMVIFLMMQTCGRGIEHSTIKRQLRELSETVDTIAPPTSGRQQGVRAPECPPVEESAGEAQGQPSQRVSYRPGPLAQSVEQRTFNPLSACTPAQPEAKLRGNPRVFDARSAPGCAGLHVDRVSAGRQEGD